MHKLLNRSHHTAFSLVELSIVLVILGLLTGGILAGQSLIRAAELRSVSTEHARYVAAAQTFRDKYFQLPGDLSKATDFWGTAAACPGSVGDARTTAATCNGNGDGNIRRDAATSNEIFGFWQHLANAGLIEGRFTGVSNDATASSMNHALGVNLPRSRLSNAGWMATLPDAVHMGVSSVHLIEGSDYGNTLMLGAAATDYLRGALLKPEEAWNIDTKMDDGLAGMGKVVVFETTQSSGNMCYLLADGVTTGTPSATDPRVGVVYRLSSTDTACAIVFKQAF